MKWRSTSGDWKPHFIWFPTEIGGQWHWLEWCERRFCGDCYEVRWTRDRDERRDGEDREDGLSGEAMPARAEGIAQLVMEVSVLRGMA